MNKKIGILGAGQLGKMLAISAAKWHADIRFLDKSNDYPASAYTSAFTIGDFTDYNDVLSFGTELDVLSIEIEHVNTDAMRACKKNGVRVYPDPDILDIIKDKWTQCLFYQKHGFNIPFSNLYTSKSDILTALGNGELAYPFVQKSRSFGYDGKGIAIITSEQDHKSIIDAPSMIQEKIDIKTEIAVTVARNQNGQSVFYEPVEMVFDPEANLLDILICPARISSELRQQSIDIAHEIADKMNIVGLLAVELFVDHGNQLWVNEVAPRPHNSGHHTIENTATSQYEQLVRILSDLPLGDTAMQSPAVMVNILGEKGYTGQAMVNGMDKIVAQKSAYLHLYGKKATKPFRKMGHLTILDEQLDVAISRAIELKEQIKIIAS